MGKALLALVLLLQAADDKAAVDEAVKRFNKAYANPNAAARATAVTELGATKHDRTLKMIIPLLNADVTEVRAAAASALAGFGDWKKLVTPSLQGAMQGNAKDPKVQKAILTALGKLADPLGLPTIHGNFREPSMTVTTAAIEATGIARQKESMDALIELQKDVQKWLKNKQAGPYRKDDGQQGDDNEIKGRLDAIQKSIIKAFQDITKEKWATANEWEIWWGKKKANFEIPK
ncbi:MAG TPA: HEAT repeat domain-containing protein [Planctomycetota bacterium]|nr:HEAT repeat domain-containing protein [Planctomycetota bacterium]